MNSKLSFGASEQTNPAATKWHISFTLSLSPFASLYCTLMQVQSTNVIYPDNSYKNYFEIKIDYFYKQPFLETN